jgi:hypothetical protein
MHWRDVNLKVIVHVQITRVTSIYHSYFLYNIVWEKPIYKFPGEYFLNVNKQLEYRISCFFLKYVLFQINCCFFYMFLVYYFLCWINACDVTLVTFVIRLSRSYAILVGAENKALKTYKKNNIQNRNTSQSWLTKRR